MKKTSSLLLIIALFYGVSYGINPDILLNGILNDKKLSNKEKILKLYEKSEELYEKDAKTAYLLASKAVSLSLKENDKLLQAKSYYCLGTALYNQNKSDSAKIFIQKALSLAGKDELTLANAYHTSGNIEAAKGNYAASLAEYLKALKIFEKNNNENQIAATLSNIGNLYYYLGEQEKMYEYYTKSLKICRKIKSKIGIANNQSNLGNYYFNKNDTVNTIKSLTEAREAFHELKSYVNEANVLADIGDFYSVFYGKYDKSIQIYNEALKLLEKEDSNTMKMDIYRKISLAQYHSKDFANAVENMQKAITLTDSTNKNIVRMNHLLLTYDYIGLKNADKATEALDKYVELTDKTYKENLDKNISESETKYQTEKKELRISSLEKEKKLYGIITLTGVLSLLLLIFSIFLRYKIAKRKKQIAEQKIVQLEQEKQLVATQAVLEGETAERTRLARDLHDGLGGMLSAVKLNLFDMKQSVIVEADDVSRFNKVMDMLDKSMQELRRVAHNMMPESLSRYGLKVSLEDFCGSFPNVHFHFFGNEQRLDPKIETTIYRAVHELVNNAIKHARAENINVQLVQDEDRISVTVQDDGQGFNPQENAAGNGLQNIENRVRSVGGKMDIFSQPNKGTEISIEICTGEKSFFTN